MADTKPSLATSARRLVLRAPKVVAGITAFFATLLGIVFLLWPSLKPETPSPTRRVVLSHVTLERPVTFGAYLKRIDQPPGGLTQDVLNRPGALASFRFMIEGYKDRALPLEWQLIDRRNGEPLDENSDIRLTPEVQKDSGTWRIWVPRPAGRPHHAFIEIQLYEPRHVVAIRTLRTKPFSTG